MATISGAEVAEHHTRASCWVAIHGRVYDVTGFLDSHPGGANLILRCAGQDATEDYDSMHNVELLEGTLPASAYRGVVDPTTIPRLERGSALPKGKKSDTPALRSMFSIDDFESVAKNYLTPEGWAYYSSGADDEISKTENAKAFRKLALRPRILRNVEVVETMTTMLGRRTALPIYVSPSGLGKYAHPEAECALASGAGKEGLIQVVPTSPSMSIESIMEARISKDQPIFFQLYVNRDQVKAKALIQRVERLGVSALWITVDSPVLGKRERDDRLKAKVEEQAGFANEGQEGQGIAKIMSSSIINPKLDWDDLKWIRQTTSLPLVLKGIQSVEDAVLAKEHGMQGIVLSNHGGRSQDTAQPPILTLLEIGKYAPYLIGSGMEIYLDGGIRRGTDVLKAVALGATAVGLGRPFLYSLTGGYGENGFRRMVQILREEFASNMALAGATKISELVPEMVNPKRLERDLIGAVKL